MVSVSSLYRKFGCSLLVSWLLMSCSQQLPETFTQTDELPKIYPDYVDVTVPVNIAPLRFEMDGEWDEMAVRYSFGSQESGDGSQEIICSGSQSLPSIDDWKRLTAAAKGQAIAVETYARKDDQWTRFKTFSIYVSADSIDSHLSYRMINPSYVSYEELTINQRCLETYDEHVVYDNMLCTEGDQGQCINCHNYQQYNPERMQFHARQNHGGTSHSVQLTEVWGLHFAHGLCTFSGYCDLWYDKGVKGRVVLSSEPQFWVNLWKLPRISDDAKWSVGTEVEISNNLVWPAEGINDRFYVIPTVAMKWTF